MEQRKAAFSLLYRGSNLGLAVGPIAGGLLFNADARYIFLADGVVTLAAAFTVFGVGRTYVPGHAGRGGSGELALGFVAAIRNHPRMLLFCRFFVAHAFVYSQTTFSFPDHRALRDRRGLAVNPPVAAVGSFGILALGLHMERRALADGSRA